MNILLIYPVESLQFNDLGYNYGLGSIAAVLKQAKHSVELLILHRWDKAKIDKKINGYAPDLIGIYSASDQMQLIKQCVGYLNNKYNLPIILGGPHPTVAPAECMKIEGLMGICRGEGEFPFLELADALEKNKDFSRIKNFWFNFNGQIIKNDIRPPVEDLDSLPYPDREIFDYQKIINRRLFKDAEVMCSRGCPYSCTYCINSFLNKLYQGKFLRKRSIKNVIDELKQLKSGYKFERFIFHDDIFTMEHSYVIDFCKEYKREINLPFAINARVDAVDEEIIRILKDAGCVMILMGIESGNKYIRNMILQRDITEEQISKAFKLCTSYNIATVAYNMLGVPYENENSIKDTIDLNKRIRPTFLSRFVFRPYPGTELYDLCQEKGWISERRVKSYNEGESILDLPTISKGKIRYYHNIFAQEVKNSFLLPVVKILAKVNIQDTSLYLFLYSYYRKIRKVIYMNHSLTQGKRGYR